MLDKRFVNDGISVMKLNSKQRLFKKQLENKIKNGTYSFVNKSCIICTMNSFELLSEKDRYGLYMPVVICKNCGLVQTNPIMYKENYREFYENEYRQIYDEMSGPSEKFFREQYNHGKVIYEFIKQSIGHEIENKLVVEIGTGSGGILQFFKEKGNKIIGFDLEQNYLNFGKEKKLDLRIGTITEISLIEKPDIVIYSHVLEHVTNPIEELEMLAKILTSSSVLYIEVPGIKHLNLSYDQNFLLYLQNAHLHHFTLNSLCNCTSRAGFQLVKGNNLIQSLFKLGEKNQNFINDYDSTIEFLRKIEINYSKKISLLKMQAKIFSVIAKIMSKTKTLHLGQVIYYKFQKSKINSDS